MCGSFCVKNDIETSIIFLKKYIGFKMVLNLKIHFENIFVIILVDMRTKGESLNE